MRTNESSLEDVYIEALQTSKSAKHEVITQNNRPYLFIHAYKDKKEECTTGLGVAKTKEGFGFYGILKTQYSNYYITKIKHDCRTSEEGIEVVSKYLNFINGETSLFQKILLHLNKAIIASANKAGIELTETLKSSIWNKFLTITDYIKSFEEKYEQIITEHEINPLTAEDKTDISSGEIDNFKKDHDEERLESLHEFSGTLTNLANVIDEEDEDHLVEDLTISELIPYIINTFKREYIGNSFDKLNKILIKSIMKFDNEYEALDLLSKNSDASDSFKEGLMRFFTEDLIVSLLEKNKKKELYKLFTIVLDQEEVPQKHFYYLYKITPELIETNSLEELMLLNKMIVDDYFPAELVPKLIERNDKVAYVLLKNIIKNEHFPKMYLDKLYNMIPELTKNQSKEADKLLKEIIVKYYKKFPDTPKELKEIISELITSVIDRASKKLSDVYTTLASLEDRVSKQIGDNIKKSDLYKMMTQEVKYLQSLYNTKVF